MFKNFLNKSLELNLILTILLIIIILPNNFSNLQGYKLSLDILVSLFIIFTLLSFLLILFLNLIKTFLKNLNYHIFFWMVLLNLFYYGFFDRKLFSCDRRT